MKFLPDISRCFNNIRQYSYFCFIAVDIKSGIQLQTEMNSHQLQFFIEKIFKIVVRRDIGPFFVLYTETDGRKKTTVLEGLFDTEVFEASQGSRAINLEQLELDTFMVGRGSMIFKVPAMVPVPMSGIMNRQQLFFLSIWLNQ